MAPSEPFLEHQIIKKYLQNVVPGCLEDRVKHLWTQILRHYFPLEENYGIEREPYASESGLGAVDLLVTGLLRREIYKVLFLEAKRAPSSGGNITLQAWREAHDQLQRNINKWGHRKSNIPVYGLVVIGHYVRFYVIGCNQVSLAPFERQETLSLKTNANRVHDLLSSMETLIATSLK
ncbi:uncharacterized protein N7482_001513 [Penicillium canariense]|uniref:Uncharacterized protein n=1 Tax=Penicillium canariense TaxID=189055 RepID=A0A9W9IHB6_9EURO|nr:uncharacterized protein N7482_001513 [Penicillium canariense]KAJ5175636.1 hypothetical protein N7482_001513 [Penicillium canariense]